MSPKVTNILRYVLGVFILIFGINKFANFLPPPEISGDGATLMGIYVTSGFFMIIGVLEIVAALGLLANKFVPLSLTIITAIMFNALVFHLLHDPAGSPGAVVGLLLSLALVYGYRDRMNVLKA